jgi:hypothetical protein
MFPVKLAHYFDKPAPPQPKLEPGRARPAAHPPKLVVVQGIEPDEDRRVANRRVSERREKEQAAFLDTRTPLGRRRTAGRRAEDQIAPAARKSISIKA